MRSLRSRLRWRLFQVLGLGAIAASILGVMGGRELLLEQFDGALRARGNTLATLVKATPNGPVEFDFADEFMPEFEDPNHPHFFRLWLGKGEVLESSRSLRSGELAAPVGWETGECRDVVLPDKRPGRALVLRIVPQMDSVDRPPRVPGAISKSGAVVTEAEARTRRDVVTLHLSRGTEELSHAMRRGLLGLVVLLVCVGVLTYFAVESASRYGLAPLRELAEAVSAIEAEALSLDYDQAKSARELLPIVRVLNDLLQRLDEAFARQKRFTSAAAHELKNPLAELQTSCEVALRFPEPESAQEALRATLEITANMEGVLSRLLALARAGDPSRLEIALEETDLRELLGSVVESYQGSERQLILDLEVERVRTDATLLKTAVENLVANAMEYSTGVEHVSVQARAEDGSLVVCVTNPAAQLSEEDLPRLAEPFWRLEAAQVGPQHSGLGLALADELARALGGSLEASLSEERLQIALRLPREAEEVSSPDSEPAGPA